MSPTTERLAQLASELSKTEKAELMNALLASLDKPDEATDAEWGKKIEALVTRSFEWIERQ